MIVAAVLAILVVREATATEKPYQDHTCQGGHNCNDGGGDIDIDADLDVDVDSHSEADADAQADASASATNEGNTVTSSTHIDARTPGRSFIGGGDSTAPEQKVFAISGGWLTGSAGIRWDWTDKEARTLRIADDYEADGLIGIADDLRCSLRRIYRNVGGSKTKCRAEVDQARQDAASASQVVPADEIAELRRMVRELSQASQRAAYDAQDAENCAEPCPDCDEQATRAFQACVAK